MSGYTYRGSDCHTIIRSLTFNPGKCGTRAGYRQHQNHGIPICPDCRAANNTYMTNYYRTRQVT